MRVGYQTVNVLTSVHFYRQKPKHQHRPPELDDDHRMLVCMGRPWASGRAGWRTWSCPGRPGTLAGLSCMHIQGERVEGRNNWILAVALPLVLVFRVGKCTDAFCKDWEQPSLAYAHWAQKGDRKDCVWKRLAGKP